MPPFLQMEGMHVRLYKELQICPVQRNAMAACWHECLARKRAGRVEVFDFFSKSCPYLFRIYYSSDFSLLEEMGIKTYRISFYDYGIDPFKMLVKNMNVSRFLNKNPERVRCKQIKEDEVIVTFESEDDFECVCDRFYDAGQWVLCK